jgi:predicted component of type VI protein secretion system
VLNSYGVILSGVATTTNSNPPMDDRMSEIDQKLSILKQKTEQDLQDTQENLQKTMDSKIEELEERLARRIEEILHDKLEKIKADVKKIINMI